MSGNTGKFWLDDDLEWAELRQRTENQPVTKIKRDEPNLRKHAPSTDLPIIKQPEASPKKVELSVNISLPKIPKLLDSKKLLNSIVHKKHFVLVALTFGVLIFGGLVFKIVSSNIGKHHADAAGVTASVSQKPSFNTILPAGKTDETTSNKVGYDPDKKVASFTDRIGDTSITVSEQELPAALRENTASQIENLAKSFNANDAISAGTTKAYIGTSAKGPQSVVLTKNNLLIFMYSEKKISDALWSDYIETLQ